MFGTVDQGLGEIEDLDLDALSTGEMNELAAGFQQRRARMDAVEAKVLSTWDARKCWQVDNAKTGPAWLAWKGRLPIQDTRKKVRHARFLRQLPAVAEAWAAGEIDRAHVQALQGVLTVRTAEAFATDHKVLVDAARLRSFTDFERITAQWERAVDLDGAEQGAAAEAAAREVYLSQSFGGMWFGKITYDRVNGTIVHNELNRLDREMFEADWVEAKARLGRDPQPSELTRTPAQRRADALVEMALRSGTAPADGKRPAPSIEVLVGYETFAGSTAELFNRTPVTPGTITQLMNSPDGFDIERIVFDGPSRVIDVGAKRRFYRGALRRAIEIRDRVCFDKTCDETPERPEIDHRQPASRGGDTTQANGRLGCRFHNQHRDHDDWRVHDDSDVFPTQADVTNDPDPPDDG